MRLRAATRGSPLARWQADHVAALLRGRRPGRRARGRRRRAPTATATRRADLARSGGKGVFVKEVQAAVLDGRADLAVHSAKDLPSTTPDGLVIAAVPERADPRDALVGRALADLPPGATRRHRLGPAPVPARRPPPGPDLRRPPGQHGHPARRRPPTIDAVVVAVAALDRLGRSAEASPRSWTPTIVLPQVGQGTLAVECRADDEATRALLAAIEHEPSRRTLRRRAGLPGRARRRLRPPGRRLRRRRRRRPEGRGPDRVARRPRRPPPHRAPVPTPRPRAGPWPASCSTRPADRPSFSHDRLPGRGRAGGPGAAHRAGGRGAGPGRRGRLRPAVGRGAARPGPGPRRAHQRGQAARRHVDPAGRDQPPAGRARPGRPRPSCA